MQEGIFKNDELRLCDWQFTIRHLSTNAFHIGEKVFLKSNPEHVMTVHSVNKKTVTTLWYNSLNEIEVCEFPPQCILQYRYAGLVTNKKICNKNKKTKKQNGISKI